MLENNLVEGKSLRNKKCLKENNFFYVKILNKEKKKILPGFPGIKLEDFVHSVDMKILSEEFSK